MEIKIVAVGHEVPGRVEFDKSVKPLCDHDHAPMVWGSVQVGDDSSYPAFVCHLCNRRFTQYAGYHTGDMRRAPVVACANDQQAMALTEISQEGDTWTCTVAGCGRIELHRPDRG
jgi:hypothetical protein